MAKTTYNNILTRNTIFLLLVCLLAISRQSVSSSLYNVVRYGAKSNGAIDSTSAFTKAWAVACASVVPSTVYVPRGKFVVKAVIFQGPCRSRVTLKIDGTVLAPSNYWNIGNSGYWILFRNVNGVSVYGGAVDARAHSLWACRMAGKQTCPNPAKSISFERSRNVVVNGLTSLNSQFFHFFIAHSANVDIRNVKINAPSWSPNTDGIHVQDSSNVIISSSVIQTGDDCISLGPGSKNVWIEKIACGPGHGISIGSLGGVANEDVVKNVVVTSVVFTGTKNGLRIKTWATGYAGSVSAVEFKNIIMNNIFNPILVDQKYCPSKKNCPNKSSGVEISGVSFSHIKGTTATQIATQLICSSSKPCWGIKFRDVNLVYYSNKLKTTSHCEHAGVTTSGVVVPRSCTV